VLVRLTRIDDLDLSLFTFDYDLTFAVFFLNAEEQVYARYGGRDGKGPDERQSLDGLRYTMNSVLQMHERKDKAYAPREEVPQYIRQIARGGRSRGCYHCHQVQEILNDELKRTGKWERDQIWRYPLPDNLGMFLELDRGNVVQRVAPESPADRAGLEPGDLVERLNGVPLHSQADAQFALDRAPAQGPIPVTWTHAGQARSGAISLSEGWRKGDISWRTSLRHWVPYLPLNGTELTVEQKKALGLSPPQLAFRQRDQVHSWVQAAGIRGGDIILGVDEKQLDGMEVDDFRDFIHRAYVVGDRVHVNVMRDGKRLSLPITLRER
jgi:serine protease Do